jgi:ectoine hydroxylase-related dioxygenase (phytanoyl-CoA dioxygenase family)
VSPSTEGERLAEAVAIRGWGVVPALLTDDEVFSARQGILDHYADELRRHEVDSFDSIRDSNIARGLAYESAAFAKIATSERVDAIVAAVLGRNFVLFSQNGIINPPTEEHFQGAWHRDLNYQHWVSTSPLAVSILVALDDFSAKSGATQVLSGSHKVVPAPSKEYRETYAETLEMSPGDAVVFDSMLFHRAGRNSGARERVALNHIFSIPLIRQQFAFSRGPAAAAIEGSSSRSMEILGHTWDQPTDPFTWREQRLRGRP